jgi:RimJ/RimL family protein N-acetyltransferase
MRERYCVEWPASDGVLRAVEPSLEEITCAAHELSRAYNDPHNRAMMAHDEDMTPNEVIAAYEQMQASAGRAFLLYRDGALAGDADFRHIELPSAEFAILVAARAAQGMGLGTRFALMLHAFAFRALSLERIYVTILPQNAASLRVFEKLGYTRDASAQARAYIDAPDDITMSVGRGHFERIHGQTLASIHYTERVGLSQ